jgi:hypothetical protein
MYLGINYIDARLKRKQESKNINLEPLQYDTVSNYSIECKNVTWLESNAMWNKQEKWREWCYTCK